jgi:inhibitor of cysteine peptidase
MKGKCKQWFLPVILSILVILILSACDQTSSATPTPVSSTVPISVTPVAPSVRAVDESFNGKEVKMTPGELLQVSLDSNPTTGFKWELIGISDIIVLEKVSDIFERPMIKQQEGSPPIVGAGGKEFWSFKALKKGTATVSMAYSRPWEGGEKGVNKFSLSVVVE